MPLFFFPLENSYRIIIANYLSAVSLESLCVIVLQTDCIAINKVFIKSACPMLNFTDELLLLLLYHYLVFIHLIRLLIESKDESISLLAFAMSPL